MMVNLKGVILTALLSQTAWIVLYCVDKFPSITQSPIILLPVGGVALSLVFLAIKIALPPDEFQKINPSFEKRGLLYYMCCLFAWACVVDGIFYLEVMEIIKGFVASYYLKSAEPYLGTSFGTLANLWDVVLHYFCYFKIIYCIDNGKGYRNTLLFYLGSMLASMICLLVGGLGGIHGDLHPCTMLNTPFLLLPIYVLLQTLHKERKFTARKSKTSTFNYQVLRFVITLATLFVLAYGFVRGLGALGSPFPPARFYANSIEPYILEPSKIGAVWVLFMMFAGSIVWVFMMYGMFNSGCEWMLDWSIFFAGFALYGSMMQFAQFCTGIHPDYHPTTDASKLVIAGNLTVALVAILYAVLCSIDQDFFRKANFKRD